MADDDIDDVGGITGEDWLRDLYGSGVTPNVQFGTDSPGSGSEFAGPMGIISSTDSMQCSGGTIPVYVEGQGFRGCYSPDESWIQPFLDNSGKFATFPSGTDPSIYLGDTGDYDQYGWLQNFINIFRPYVEDQDVDDIDRIFRQEQAQEFQELLGRIYAGEATWRDLNKEDYDFLIDIPEFSDYFDDVYEQAQYNGLLQDMEKAEDPEDWQTIFDEYGAAKIEDNSYISENGLGFINPQQVLDRLILGDADWGVTVQMCSSTVTTNCVDPKAINDIWEDFGRHIQVIFKGLEIPGLPDWLPLPGILRLPTIGEIWDTITGPFNEAARDQLNECMAGEDGVVGTNPETGINDDKLASVCYEERDIAGIITEGIINGAGDIIDATTDAVGGMVDKVLEGVDCVLNPKDCASKIKDVIDGILGGADPTQPGIPDWMRVIIIGSQYGDDILKELEDLFGTDIDGDGTIGLVPEPVECGEGEADFGNGCEAVCEYDSNIPASSDQCVAPWQDDGPTAEQCKEQNRSHVPGNAATETASTCGECLSGFEEVEGQCQEKEDPIENQGPTAQECADQNRDFNEATDVADSSCGPCLEGFEEDSAGNCVATPTATCEDPNSSTFGQQGECGPCKSGFEKGEDGTCVEVIPDPACEDPNAVNYGEIGECGECKQGFEKGPDGVCIESTSEATCEDPNAVNYGEVGECGECKQGFEKGSDGVCVESAAPPKQGSPCKTEDGLDGTLQPVQTLGFGPQPASPELECVANEPDDGDDDTGDGDEGWDGECTSPRPNAASSFQAQEDYRRWNEQCAATHCPSGVPKIDEFDDCSGEYTPCDQQNRVTNEDGSCGECKPGFTPDSEGFDQCVPAPPECNDCSCAEYAAANPVECTVCPEGESYCEATGQCETAENCPSGDDDSSDSGASIGGGGGGGMLTGQPLDLSFDIAGDPTLLARTEFPITDYLAGIFTNSNGGRNV